MRARLGGRRDGPVPEVVILAQRQADGHQPGPCAWDAWDGVRPDAVADAARRHPALADEDAGKSAAPALAVRARDAFRWALPVAEAAASQYVAAGLYRQDAARSAAQSCAAQEAAGGRAEPVQWDWPKLSKPEAQKIPVQTRTAQQLPAAQPQPEAAQEFAAQSPSAMTQPLRAFQMEAQVEPRWGAAQTA